MPWIHVNYYTFLSTIGRIFGKPRIEIQCQDSRIYAKGAEKIILFNLARRFMIEKEEFRGERARCPRVNYLLVIAAKSGKETKIKAVFPKV